MTQVNLNVAPIAAVVCALALGLGGCGGGDDEGAQASSSAAVGLVLDPPASTLSYADRGGAETAAEAPTTLTARALGVSTSDAATSETAGAVAAPMSFDFDNRFNILPAGWWVNWWGSVKPSYSTAWETRPAFVHSGAGSFRFAVSQVASGSGAHLVYSYPFKRNSTYKASVWVKGDTAAVGRSLDVQLRRDVAPFNIVASKLVTLSEGWQRIEIQGSYSWAETGSLRFVPVGAGYTVFVDSVQIDEIVARPSPTTAALALPSTGGSSESVETLKSWGMNDSFNTFSEGWYFNSFGGTSQGAMSVGKETRPAYVYEGTSSQRFQVVDKKGGELHMIAPYTFEKGKTYRISMMVRSDVPTDIQFFARRDQHPWDSFASKSATATTSWQKVEIQGALTPDAPASIRVSIKGATGTIWVDNVTVQVVSRNDLAPVDTSTVADSLFGMHVNELGVHKTWPGLETQILRLWNTGTTWRDLQPSGDTWDFSKGAGQRLDMYVDYAKRNNPGGSIIYTLGMTPRWASSTPNVSGLYGLGSSGAPSNFDTWRRYVRTLAQRYAGRITYWELWNEPDYAPHWTGGSEALVKLAQIAREELLAADPNNKLLGPGFSEGQGMRGLDQFLASGGGQYIDIVAFHWYYHTDPESLAPKIDNVRNLMASYGVGGKPIWNTEGAFTCDSSSVDCTTAQPTADQQKSVNARAMFIMAARGVKNFNFHVWEAADPFRRLVASDKATPTTAAKAFGVARGWIRGARVTDAYSTPNGVYVLRLTRGSVHSYVVWSAVAAATVSVPAAWSVSRVRTVDDVVSNLPGERMLAVGLTPLLLTP